MRAEPLCVRSVHGRFHDGTPSRYDEEDRPAIFRRLLPVRSRTRGRRQDPLSEGAK